MTHFWKWLGLAACGVGLLVATDRVREVTASEDGAAYERGGDLGGKIDRLTDKLDQLFSRMDGRMGRGGPPREGAMERERGDRDRGDWDRGHRERGPAPGGHPSWGGPAGGPRDAMRPGVPPEMRERLEQARGAMQERMEKARERFQQLEDRVKSLEAEVERLKASQQG